MKYTKKQIEDYNKAVKLERKRINNLRMPDVKIIDGYYYVDSKMNFISLLL